MLNLDSAEIDRGIFLRSDKKASCPKYLAVWKDSSGIVRLTDLDTNEDREFDPEQHDTVDYDVVPREKMPNWLDERSKNLEKLVRIARDQLFAAEETLRKHESSSTLVRHLMRR